jgi:hypothetical protein
MPTIAPTTTNRLTCTYAIANLEGMRMPIIAPARVRRLARNAREAVPEGEGTLGTQLGPTLTTHGQPAAEDGPAETGPPHENGPAVTGPPHEDANVVDSPAEATVPNRARAARRVKVVLPRSPLPVRAKRSANPRAPDMARPKRTPGEVKAAALLKASLQRQAEDLEKRRIESVAEMEVEEEFEKEEEKRTVVRKFTHASSPKGIKDNAMLSDDEDIEDNMMQVVDDGDNWLADSEVTGSSGSDNEEANGGKVATTNCQVCHLPPTPRAQVLKYHTEKEKGC